MRRDARLPQNNPPRHALWAAIGHNKTVDVILAVTYISALRAPPPYSQNHHKAIRLRSFEGTRRNATYKHADNYTDELEDPHISFLI